ncbi:hypothetical protein [Aquimarina macrocephali]|uniref:hypothetical protein n=1 Tax=Aquimarina macrocephali TaxID=666563 RepID=UPI003F67656C
MIPVAGVAGRAGNVARTSNALARASKASFTAADDLGSIFVKNEHLNIGSGKFVKFNTTDIGIARQIVQEALRSPNAQFLSNPNLLNTFRVHTNLGRVIGTKGQTSVRVIVGFDSKVINAFPIK